MKEKNFERIDELLLVKGITRELFDAMRPFVTVWGDGRIHVNTASSVVWRALGLDPSLVAKIIGVRKGADSLENTEDDHVFYRTFDIASEVDAVLKLEDKEINQINQMNARGIWTTDSVLYSMTSRVISDGENPRRVVEAVFNTVSSKFEYWHER
jgi:hypothetical protein